MSLMYASKRSSLVVPIPHETSKSVPQTPARRQPKPVFRTVPDSPKHCRLLSDDHGLDLEILTHKLQLYQLELEEAELRFKQRRMVNKEADEVAAAARFREGLANRTLPEVIAANSDQTQHTPVANEQAPRPYPNRTSSLKAPRMRRAKRPDRLLLTSMPNVAPQEVQSALLPVRRNADLHDTELNKRHWRRTTISAGRAAGSTVIMISSPGILEEHDFNAEIPPVPELSESTSTVASPSLKSPTLLPPTEDQIRREIETFALEEGPDILTSRRGSATSRKHLPAAFVPDPEDRIKPKSPILLEFPLIAPVPTSSGHEAHNSAKTEMAQKKSFFSRFERKNEVDALLDLYLTEQQLEEEKIQKRKSSKSRRQTFFKKWQSSSAVPQKNEIPERDM